jgi:predicted dienelactone hydrolase
MESYRAGCRMVEVADPVQETALPLRFVYPCHGDEQPLRFGPFEMSVAVDCPVEGHKLPLVVISHGGRASALTHRDLACHLARSGFIVAMPEHIGDCRSDYSQSGKAQNLENRPRHIGLVIDASLADPVVGPRIAARQIALIGHSMGGYTGLAVAGGHPSAGPHETPDGQVQKVAVVHDDRVRALVLMAPACAWYRERGTLRDVQVPMLLLVAEQDEIEAHLKIEYIARDCDPAHVKRRIVPMAGHHAFQSPFPAEMKLADFPAARDPAGFDRAAFQPILHAEVVSFLRGTL